jgi:hypothetical protein
MLRWQNARLIASIIEISLIALGFTALAPAQKAIGAKSGVIQFATGEVLLDGAPIRLAKDDYIQIENSQNLQTTNGYVELVLAPAAYLWLGRHSSLRMRQNKLNDIQVEINQGSALVENLEKIKYFPINVHVSKSVIEIRKAGLYRLDAEPGELRVYSGVVLAKNGKKQTRITKGRMINLDSESAPAKFDVKSVDDLHRLATNRSAELVVWRKHSEIESAMRTKIYEIIEVTLGVRKLDLQSQADQELQRMQAMQRQQQDNAKLQQEQEMRRIEYQAWENQQQNRQQQQQPQPQK